MRSGGGGGEYTNTAQNIYKRVYWVWFIGVWFVPMHST